jgi:hypothetical protein
VAGEVIRIRCTHTLYSYTVLILYITVLCHYTHHFVSEFDDKKASEHYRDWGMKVIYRSAVAVSGLGDEGNL